MSDICEDSDYTAYIATFKKINVSQVYSTYPLGTTDGQTYTVVPRA